MVEPDKYSSISSGELFAGESMPFQYSESGKNDKTMKENSEFKCYSTDDNESVSANHDIDRYSPVTYQNLSDSALFGSGYNKNFQKTPNSSRTSYKAGSIEACSGLLPNTQTTQGNAHENVNTEYDVPKGTRSVTLSDVKIPEMTLIKTEPSVPKTIVSVNHVHPASDRNVHDRPDLTQLYAGSSGNLHGIPTAMEGVIHESETGVENAKHAYQVPQNVNVRPMQMNEQQRVSQFPSYTGQPAYPYPPYGFPMHALYPGFYGPMPGTQPNQQPQFMPFPAGIPPQYAGLGENTSSNSQGINQQLPLYSPHNLYTPYMFPPYGQQMYPPNFPLMPGQMKTPCEMAQPMHTDANGHTYKTPVSRKEIAPKQNNPAVTDDDTQDYMTPVSRHPEEVPTKHNEEMELRLHATDGVHTKDVVSETSSGSKSKGRIIR